MNEKRLDKERRGRHEAGAQEAEARRLSMSNDLQRLRSEADRLRQEVLTRLPAVFQVMKEAWWG